MTEPTGVRDEGAPEERIRVAREQLAAFERGRRDHPGTATFMALDILTNRIGLHLMNAADPDLPVEPITGEDLARYYEVAVGNAISTQERHRSQNGRNQGE